MNRFRWRAALAALVVLVVAGGPSSARAQRRAAGPNDPHIGYVFPAGGQRGQTFQVVVGGQYLAATREAVFSGQGVRATVVGYHRPLTNGEANRLRNKIQEIRDQVRKELQKKRRGRRGPLVFQRLFRRALAEAGITEEQLKALDEFRRLRRDPKRQPNPQISETVTLEVTIDPDAEPGVRELRLVTPAKVSNPIRFVVGELPEFRETEPNEEPDDATVVDSLPAVLNGQILPGDVDRFRFRGRKGQRLVVAVQARKLVPYLADAVPGWFQATVSLCDAEGRELAFDDDFRFDPDPVLYYELPRDGQYELTIRDALYRGREDFVYRMTVGEIPWVTGLFPLGAEAGTTTTVQLFGWNLPTDRLTVDASQPGRRWLWVDSPSGRSNSVPFVVDRLPGTTETEPNDSVEQAEPVLLPVVVNGRMDRPGDRDVFRFHGKAGQTVVAEVYARRLNSPLDSLIALLDQRGRVLATNDDSEDPAAGLVTHHADSRLQVRLPADGTYYLALVDAQNGGGPEFAYRLRLSGPQPDFELRVVPSSVNARAGDSVPITVYALRRDGFDGDIFLELDGPNPNVRLDAGWIPAGQDRIRTTLTFVGLPPDDLLSLRLVGWARIDGLRVRHVATPADDWTQAFIYHHLVPAQDWVACVQRVGRRARPSLRWVESRRVRIPLGGTAHATVLLPRFLALQGLQLELKDPPVGISVAGTKRTPAGLRVELKADAKKAQPGLKGNLILAAYRTRTFKTRTGRSVTRRIQLATLPALTFEVVP